MSLYPDSVAFLSEAAQRGDAASLADEVRVDAGSVFTMGWCGIYAAALVEAHPTWLIVAVGAHTCLSYFPDEECSQLDERLCACMTDHFYAVDGDGWYHDVYGIHDPDALDHVTHHMVGDTAFRCLLESWYDCFTDADHAAWARQLVTTKHPANV